MHIRKANINDLDALTECIYLPMHEIVFQFTNNNDIASAKEFLRTFIAAERNQYSYQNCLVAEWDGQVMGAGIVYDGAQLSKLRQPILDHVRQHFNPHFNPEDETGTGEYYIDSIGVLPSAQGRGVGAALLKAIIQTYVKEQGQTLGLIVEQNNPKALALYLKTGFRQKGTPVFAGKKMFHLQISPEDFF